MACVLCDGSPASLKAIDLAVVPQLVLKHHKDEQLIMIHSFEDTAGAAYAAAAPPNISALQQQASAFQSVINVTLEQIDKHKHAKDTLNYKIEVFRTTKPARPTSAPPAAQVPSPARAATPASGAGSKPGTGKGGTHPPPAAVEHDDAFQEARAPPAAELLAGYAAKRATHHKIHTFVLGVGNQSNGKTYTVGRTAKELYLKQYNPEENRHTDTPHSAHHKAASPPAWSLWFVKPTGAVVRPGGGVKFLVLLDAQTPSCRPLLALRYTLNKLVVPGRGDRVSVLIVTNNNVSSVLGCSADDADETKMDANAEKMIAGVKERLRKADFVDSAVVAGDDSTEGESSPNRHQEEHDESANSGAPLNPSPPNAFPLVSELKLEGNNANPRPNINDVPQQLTKALAKLKTDFLVIPPTAHHTLSEGTVMQLLSLLRPHVIIPPSLLLEAD